MDRRAFLATAAAVTAGCGQSGGPESETSTGAGGTSTGADGTTAGADGTSAGAAGTPTDAPAVETESPTETPEPEPASVDVTAVTAPSTIEIGTAGTLSVTLENTGGRGGSFSAPVEARVGTDDWEDTEATVEVTVPAGESVTETVDLPPNGYVEPASYRLAGADPVARTRFVPRELSLGDAHALPNGVEIAVDGAQFTDTYTYESPDGETTADPAGGDKWAIGAARAENPTDEPARAPLVSDVAFFRGEEEYSYQHLGDNRDRYRGGDLDPGAVSEGDLPANVPEDADRADLRVEYSETLDGGEITVRWSLTE